MATEFDERPAVRRPSGGESSVIVIVVLALLAAIVVLAIAVNSGRVRETTPAAPESTAGVDTGVLKPSPVSPIDVVRREPGIPSSWKRLADDWARTAKVGEISVLGARATAAVLAHEPVDVNDEAILDALDAVGPLSPEFYLRAASDALDINRGPLAARLLDLTARRAAGSPSLLAQLSRLRERANTMTAESGSASGDSGALSSDEATGARLPVGTSIMLSAPFPLEVSVDGSPARRGTEFREAVTVGRHEVTVAAPDVFMADTSYTVEVPDGVLVDLSARLPRMFQLTVSAAGKCRISIDGREIDWAPVTVPIVGGPHQVVFHWTFLDRRKTDTVVVSAPRQRLHSTIPPR